MVHEGCECEDGEEDEKELVARGAVNMTPAVEALKVDQRNDKDLKPLIAFLEGKVPEEDGQPRFKERMATLRRRTDDYVIDPDDGLLKYKGQLGASNVDRPLIVVPRRQQPRFVYAYHNGPMGGMHKSRDLVLASLRTTYWWSTMARDVQRHIRRYLACRKRNTLLFSKFTP